MTQANFCKANSVVNVNESFKKPLCCIIKLDKTWWTTFFNFFSYNVDRIVYDELNGTKNEKRTDFWPQQIWLAIEI